MLVIRGDALRQELAIRNIGGQSEVENIEVIDLLELRRCVITYNSFVANDLSLRSRDEALSGPDAAKIVATADLKSLIEGARSHGLVAEDAGSALEEESALVDGVGEGKARRLARAGESVRNFVRAGLGYLWRHKMSVASVPPAAYAIGKYIVANQEALVRMFSYSTHMRDAIQRVIEWVATLPLA